ncbi:hypothetical protein OH492_14630 [Vibrio chagasii]|nr:hypothetical protein [Vibrio chagasii]
MQVATFEEQGYFGVHQCQHRRMNSNWNSSDSRESDFDTFRRRYCNYDDAGEQLTISGR